MSGIRVANITVKLGDTDTLPLTIIGPDGAPLDVTNAQVIFRAWTEGENTDVLGPKDFTIVDGPSGRVSIALTSAEKSVLVPGTRYWYDVRVEAGATITEGRLFVEAARVR